jgi:CDP-diacylglycerol--serine O-phosphatidyltransferase
MEKRRLRSVELRDRFYRRRYLVPNAVTLGNMFCGFLAIIYATSNRLENAALAIGLAILLDGLDGRVARKLQATSKFGVEFDSFSDLVSFGVAPAILMYNWCFRVPADEWGVFVTFVYALCAAGRLARFNISDPNLKAFTGLPTPGAAGVIAAFIHAMPLVPPGYLSTFFGTIVMLFLSYLMVSKVEFFSIKTINLARIHPMAFLALGMLIALIWYSTRIGLLVLATGYCASGVLRPLVRGRESKPSSTDAVA